MLPVAQASLKIQLRYSITDVDTMFNLVKALLKTWEILEIINAYVILHHLYKRFLKQDGWRFNPLYFS